jgi:hypothetical protein
MKTKALNILVLVAIILGLVLSAQPALAISLPSGTVIDSATLFLFVHKPTPYTVNIHRVTADWSELGVTWNNFGGAYDPTVVASFVPDTYGMMSVDITSLVQGWVDEAYPNYGLLLEQGATEYTRYISSEMENLDWRPALEICFNGSCELIRRGVDGTVADAWISALYPDTNGGSDYKLLSGLVGGKEKQSLLRFDIELTPPPPEGEGCTPGFWRQEQHFDSWIGYNPGDSYDGTFAVDGSFLTLLDAVWAQGGDENALARHAVAALLNAASPDVDYFYSETQIIQMVQDAYSSGDFETIKDLFEYENELGCPLD